MPHLCGSQSIQEFDAKCSFPPVIQFHWQGFSHYTKPITLMGGDSMRITCSYDTMDRDTVTTWGEGTYDEMCIAFFFMTEQE